jgi:hypothetical protein
MDAVQRDWCGMERMRYFLRKEDCAGGFGGVECMSIEI